MKQRRYQGDLNKRHLYKKTEVFQRVWRFLFFYFQEQTWFLKLMSQSIFISKMLRNSFKTRIKNYCIVTGRSRGVYRDFRVSRISLRHLGAEGLFFGLQKASW